ncbi:MAG: DNA recombination protein RecO, partial [Pseudomonadota bacterium]|nr:DNA recombination protein RecO [Pseudomonadota bacterium]
LDAICSAGAARDWVAALALYEALLLRELGYGGQRPEIADLGQALEILDRQEPLIGRYLLADTRADVLAARHLLRQRLARMIS